MRYETWDCARPGESMEPGQTGTVADAACPCPSISGTTIGRWISYTWFVGQIMFVYVVRLLGHARQGEKASTALTQRRQ